MKCADCLFDYLNDEARDHLTWINISEAETVSEGVAVCLVHFAERMGEPT